MSESNKQAAPDRTHLSPGQYFGEIIANQRCCDLVLTEVRHTRGNRFPAHSHELAFFSLLLDGSYTELCGRKSIDYKQLMTVYRPPAVTHSDRIGGSGVRLFTVEIKDSWLERMRQYGPVNSLSLEPIGGELAWLAARLYRQFRDRDPHGPLAIEGIILEMLATLGRNSRLLERQPPGWLSKVREILHAEYSENVSIRRIADDLDLEPYYLSKIFRRFQNQTIAEYIQDLRVKHASSQLLNPEAELSDVALAAGFSDQSHLTRIFKRVTGMTPGAFRSAFIMNPGLPSAESEPGR
jgi:AraC family transcriptional regulator